jgi:transcriptional antiterminator NusG
MSLSDTFETSPCAKVYGCAFCVTGKEETVAQSIEESCADIRATPVRQIKRKTTCGRTSLIAQVAFPGYVFLEVEPCGEAIFQLPRENLKALLMTPNSGWKLSGEDERYARWIFANGGLIALSKACMEGERVRIVSGPLKDLEGHIIRIDKRNRSGQIMLTFNNRVIKTWLGFEMIEKESG